MKAFFRSSALLLLAFKCISAQVSTGTITGYVHDSSDAAVVGAKVSIVQQATSERRETITNERGEFNAPYLRRGEYSITVTAPGLKGQTYTGVVLAVDQTVRLPFVLQPGVVEQSIEVTAGAPLVDSATSSLGQVIDNKKIVDLPLNGRNPFALGLLSGSDLSSSASALPCGSAFQHTCSRSLIRCLQFGLITDDVDQHGSAAWHSRN